MAKDPAFLFYPGDASEDTQFMNRLERGCYFDILKAQKKFKRFSLDQIKKVLGADFSACWPAIELVLGKDEKGYFIEWLETSIENRREHSKKQKERIEAYWERKRLEEATKNNTTDIPRNNHGNTTEQPLENEDVIENGNENENTTKGGMGENYLVPQMQTVFKKHIPSYLPDKERDYKPLYSIAKFLCQQGNVKGPPENHVEKIIEAWDNISAYIASDKFYKQKSLSTISNHIQEITQKALHGDESAKKSSGGKLDQNLLKSKLANRFGKTG